MASPARIAAPEKSGDCWQLDRSGSFRLRDANGRVVEVRGRKAQAIIAYLATHSGDRVSRDRLAELLWADRGEAQARGSLRQSLLEIRRAAPGLLNNDHGHVWIDCARLRHCEPDRCSEDEELFDDLDGITREFDEWLRCERAQDASEEWSTLKHRVENLIARSQGPAAIPLIERMQRIDPYNEDWLRLAMRAECQAGHPAGIQTRFREMDNLLKRDLGVTLSTQTRALHDELLAELSCTPRPQAPPAESQAETPPPTEAISRSSRSSRWLPVIGGAALVAMLGMSQSARTAASAPNRIAVLPFEALGGVDSALAEGMATEVLANLSQQSALQTVGRTSSWVFKDKLEDLRQVGRKLDVKYIVEGTVSREGTALRLNVDLIDASDASTLWAGRFMSPAADVQRVENAATKGIVQRLGLQVTDGNRHADPRAYEMYVRAKSMIRERNWTKMDEAADLLRDAIKIDPRFAPAWAQLGAAIYFTRKTTPELRREALNAARHAIALDPTLADGHAMLGLLEGFDTPEGREHLRRALQLEPSNPQTVYWWANSAGQSGNYPMQEKAVRRAMALDPLWVRPVEVAANFSLYHGRRSEAYSYLQRLRSADRAAAVEVEMSMTREQGDLSRVIELGRSAGNLDAVASTDATVTLAWSLIEMGYVREALLLCGAPPFQREVYLRRLPDRDAILSATRDLVGTATEMFELRPLLFELARTGRHADIAALFDRPGSVVNRLQRIEEGNREDRAMLAATLGRSLAQLGRRHEAEQLFRASDEATRVILANGDVPPEITAEMALDDSILGRKARALALLETAVRRGWFAYDGLSYRLDEMPGLSSLRGDPRFERLVRVTNARRDRERRETAALNLI